MPANVSVIGIDKIMRKLGTEELTDDAKADIFREAGEIAKAEAERRAPRRTGALAKSFRLEASPQRARVSTPVFYARFLEHGTRHMRKRRFMTPARAKVRKAMPALLDKAAKKIENWWGR